MIDIHDAAAVDAWARARKVDPGYVRRARVEFYKKSRGLEAAARLPAGHQSDFLRDVRCHTLTLAAEQPSTRDSATKLIYRTERGMLIESVLMRIASGRVSLCISSQVGCAANCSFCATGKMGIAHNLSCAEIVDQIVFANERLASEQCGRVRNIVFMGMGEPLHNESQVFAALELLANRDAFHYSPQRIAVSTIGIPEAMIRLARRFPRVRQAVSLHAARESVRRELMPATRSHTLFELRQAIAEVSAIGKQAVMVEYLLLSGVNDGDEDIATLADFLQGLDAHINLIPYNPIDDAPFATTPVARREAIARHLKASGFKVTLRYSLGADIEAACGQLVQRENRRIARAISGIRP